MLFTEHWETFRWLVGTDCLELMFDYRDYCTKKVGYSELAIEREFWENCRDETMDRIMAHKDLEKMLPRN